MLQHGKGLINTGLFHCGLINDELNDTQNGSFEFFSMPNSKIKKIFWAISPITAWKFFRVFRHSGERSMLIANGEFFPFLLFLILILKLHRIRVLVAWHDVCPHVFNKFDYFMNILSYMNVRLAGEVLVHNVNFMKENKIKKVKRHFSELPPPDWYMKDKYAGNNKSCNLVGNALKDTILFIGRIEKYKGVETLIDAANLDNSINLLIIGLGNPKYITFLKESVSPDANVTIKNVWLNESEFRMTVKSVKCLLLPYIEATQSLLPLIAASEGTPIIVRRDIKISQQVVELGGQEFSDAKELVEILKLKLRATPLDPHATQIKFNANLKNIITYD